MIRTARVFRQIKLLLSIVLVASFAAPAPALADTTFKVTGGGWGHGIGLSQYGARGYALRGWPHVDILRWYYGADRDGSDSGVRVATLASLRKYPNPYVKVNIDSDHSTRATWVLRGWKTRLRVTDETTAAPVWLGSDSYQTFGVSGGKVTVGGRRYTGTVRVRAETTRTVPVPLIVVKSASGPFDRTYVRYRNEIQLKVVDGKLRAVNVLAMEYYLYGVVPRESPSSFPLEALKAQAVAARSYAWGTSKPSPVTSNYLSGILHCTTYSQVYGGHSRLVGGSSTNITAYETANAAVDATRGQVVYHEPTDTIVTTYFSAASGGHTANIEDVWLTSTPKPYYRGVPDADQAYSDYEWTPKYLTGAQIADKIRSKDMADGRRDYSVASPAVVTHVTHDRAESGYVRTATFRWSNGATYKLRGDTVRSALDLKSTKFTIAGPEWGPVRQENATGIAYDGLWGTWRNRNHSGGAYQYSWAESATATFKFTGTGFRWYAVKWPKGGRAEVLVDGRRVATVSLYAPTTKYRQAVYTRSGLSIDDTHTVTIRVLRKKDTASKGFAVGIDAVRVQSGDVVQ